MDEVRQRIKLKKETKEIVRNRILEAAGNDTVSPLFSVLAFGTASPFAENITKEELERGETLMRVIKKYKN